MAEKALTTKQAANKIERSTPKSSVPKNKTPDTVAERSLGGGQAPEYSNSDRPVPNADQG